VAFWYSLQFHPQFILFLSSNSSHPERKNVWKNYFKTNVMMTKNTPNKCMNLYGTFEDFFSE
jgi:hypothetical protein